jgi:diguanylate cyclase (GGDEF)-like protein
LTDYSHFDAAGLLRRSMDALSSLWMSGGVNGLLRRFAERLQQDFGVRAMACAALDASGQISPLSASPIDVPKMGIISGAAMADIYLALKRIILRDEELRDGMFHLEVKGATYAFVSVEVAEAEWILLIWGMTHSMNPESELVLECIVRGMQHEARWYKKIDSNQVLIYRDDLTGLFNTRYLEVAIENELKRAQRYKTSFSLLFIDLDGFKPVNDQYGHLSGSSVLTQVAHVIRDVVREVDIPIRYGGDEFVILLVGATSHTGLLVAERIRKRIADEEFRLVDQGTVRITCSIGVASFPDHGQDLGTLLKMADENMYQSKKSGKNRVSIVNRRIEESTR